MIRCFNVSGSPYEMGFKVGRAFAGHTVDIIDRYTGMLKVPGASAFAAYMTDKLQKTHPDTLQEIYGRADGAGMPREAALLMFSPEFCDTVDGCTTTYLRNSKGRIMFSHNEDNTGCTPDTVALVRYDYGDSWIVSYTMAEKLPGCSFSFNSSGMIITCNFITSADRRMDEPSRYIMIRDVLAASSLEEAVSHILAFGSASPFSINLVDTRQGRAVNVEKDVYGIYARELEDRYARANHFIIKGGEAVIHPNSLFRQEKITELVNGLDLSTANAGDLVDALGYHEDEYERCIYKDYSTYSGTGHSVTVANLSYDGETGRIILRDYVTGDSADWVL